MVIPSWRSMWREKISKMRDQGTHCLTAIAYFPGTLSPLPSLGTTLRQVEETGSPKMSKLTLWRHGIFGLHLGHVECHKTSSRLWAWTGLDGTRIWTPSPTAAKIQKDAEGYIRTHSHSVGSYCLSISDEGLASGGGIRWKENQQRWWEVYI